MGIRAYKSFKKIESAFRKFGHVSGKISGRFVTVELLRFLVNWVRQSGVLIHFPQLAPSRGPRTHLRQRTMSPPITAALAKWPRKRPPSSKAQNIWYHVLDPAAQFSTPNTWQTLWSFADVWNWHPRSDGLARR